VAERGWPLWRFGSRRFNASLPALAGVAPIDAMVL
jgi:hypothetical protein